MILFGLYTGQRLGDIARLTWANVDLPGQTNQAHHPENRQNPDHPDR
jgi:integrase